MPDFFIRFRAASFFRSRRSQRWGGISSATSRFPLRFDSLEYRTTGNTDDRQYYLPSSSFTASPSVAPLPSMTDRRCPVAGEYSPTSTVRRAASATEGTAIA
jgi:hypothetical protein